MAPKPYSIPEAVTADAPVQAFALVVPTNDLPVFIRLAKGKIEYMKPLGSDTPNGLTVDVMLNCTPAELYALGMSMGLYQRNNPPVQTHQETGY